MNDNYKEEKYQGNFKKKLDNKNLQDLPLPSTYIRNKTFYLVSCALAFTNSETEDLERS